MVQNTSDNKFGTAKWIVDPSLANGTHSTIAAALTSASAGETIFIRPGTYTENLTLKAGVNITTFIGEEYRPNVKIIGKCSFSGAGSVSISGIYLQTNSDYCISVTGNSDSVLTLTDCYINCSNNTGIEHSSSSANASISFNNCQGDIATSGITLIAHSGAGAVSFNNCSIANSGATTTQSSISGAGPMFAFNSRFWFPILTTGASTASIGFIGGYVVTSPLNVIALTINATGGTSTLHDVMVSTGTASAISIGAGATLRMEANNDINSTNAQAITGAGTVSYASITVSIASCNSTINTTTQTTRTTRIGKLLASGTVDLNTGTNAINLGTDAVQKAITLGNITGNTAVNVNTGTSGTTYTTTNGIFTLNTGTGAIGIGVDAVAKTITLGNVTGATAVNLNTGTGDITVASATGTLMKINDTGEVVAPLQSAFLAYRNVNIANQTGAGAAVIIPCDTEVYDQNADYNNGTFTFTAPVTGRYYFCGSAYFYSLTAAMTRGSVYFTATSRGLTGIYGNYGVMMNPDTELCINSSCFIDMTAGDTATFNALISSGAGNSAGIGGVSGAPRTWFAGHLVC
jgi:hypothetical protein